MKKKNMSARFKASVMSLVMAASCVPAAMISVPVGAVVSPSTDDDAETDKKTDSGIGVGEVYEGFTADVAESGLKIINITFTPDFTGKFSCGFGIGIKKSPYWLEYDAKKGFIDSKEGTVKIASTEIACKAGEPVTISFDVSKLDLSYTPSTSKYPGKFEFRNYYAGESEGTITVDKIEANGEFVTPPKPDDNPDNPDTPNKPVENVPHNNRTSSGDNWSFKDNGDGTATISSTVARQVEFGEDPIILTLGYDEDSYALEGKTPGEDDPINSHKFKYSDFGISDMYGVTVESLTAVIESEEEIDTFMYGGGLNVKQSSPADTEFAKKVAGIKGKESPGYQYNDCGADQLNEYEEAGVKFDIKPSGGATMTGAGTYIEAYWEVPAEVQPYTGTKPSDEISFQYWYGTKAEQPEDAETPEKVETVKLTSAVLTYTKEIVVPYTGSIAEKVNSMVDHTDEEKNALHVKYADLGIEDDMDIYAIRFDISAKSKVGKLVYNVGTSVTEDAVTDEEYWFQEEGDYCVLDAGETTQIMWIIPMDAAGTSSKTNFVSPDGEVYFGYYYGDEDAITIDNIEIYYDVATTTTTTSKTTTTSTTTSTTTTTSTSKSTTPTTSTKATTTTTTPSTSSTSTSPTTPPTAPTPPKVTKWGDANVDGNVNISDAVLIMQSIANPEEFTVTEQGKINGDVIDNGGGLTNLDALAIQYVEIKTITDEAFPMSATDLDALND